MNLIQSKTSNKIKNGYEIIIEIERDGEAKKINDVRIINEDIATRRAFAELLENGYEKQEVEFTTYFIDLKPNDIIAITAPSYKVPRELNKNRFIVKNIKHNINFTKATTTIKAVRYD